jgi:predicted kinase
MCGLPGAGKSFLAEALARELGVPILSVVPIEAALRRAGVEQDQPIGLAAYIVADVLAREQLKVGSNVIVDAVNDAPEARVQWRDAAASATTELLFIEVICSKEDLHRRRLQARERDLDGMPEPSWDSVMARAAAFVDWDQRRLVLDSAQPPSTNLAVALDYVSKQTS